MMDSQKEIVRNKSFGGSMRLGTYTAVLKKNTLARRVYGMDRIEERHRHRYEVNPAYIKRLEDKGLIFSGVSPDKRLCEIAELREEVHPFFVATQFHPEFKARPLSPHPLFTAFVKAILKKR